MNNPDLKQSIDRLEKSQRKLASWRWTFLRGIAYGLGFFVGGTVIVGLLIYVLSFFDIGRVIGEYLLSIKK